MNAIPSPTPSARRLWLVLLAMSLATLPAWALEPFADAHVHYKWSQAEVTSPEEAVRILDRAGVALAVVFGTPPEMALRLRDLAPHKVIPVFGPYDGRRNWLSWQFDPKLVEDARKALASGAYRGIGEMHLIGGLSAPPATNPIIGQLMELGAEFHAPLIIHSEYSSAGPFIDLCTRYPETPVILAHGGTVIGPTEVRGILERCPKVYAELAARDPWRYVNNPIANAGTGTLLPAWEALVRDFPTRFIVGSDNVWPVDQLDRWDEPDTGWNELERFLAFHRRWLSALPPDIARQVRYDNVRRLFGQPPG